MSAQLSAPYTERPMRGDSVIRALLADYLDTQSEAHAMCEALDTIPPPADDDPRNTIYDALRSESRRLVVHICATPARTLAGVQAKALAARAELQAGETAMALSALSDLIALPT
jgi:hypothetical protein